MGSAERWIETPAAPLEPEVIQGLAAKRWHLDRQRRILRDFPQLRALFGPDPWTIPFLVGTVAFQFVVAFLLREQSMWVVAAAAFGIGAFANHACGVLIHEATHNLIVRGTVGNKIWGLVANLPIFLPGAMVFRHQHLLHHRNLGDPAGDTQVPDDRDLDRVKNTLWGKLEWLVLAQIRWRGHPLGAPPKDAWLVANFVVQGIAMTALYFATRSWGSLWYLGLSSIFGFGLHPVGIRRYSEHVSLVEQQPTVSYYGSLNWVTFNVGYHVEHHDLPAIAWRRLLKARTIAAKHYGGLVYVRSWSRLLWEFLARPELSAGDYIWLRNYKPKGWLPKSVGFTPLQD